MITADLTCLTLPRPCRILDIGCGSGRHLAAAYGLDQALIIGADLQLSDLKQAQSRLQFHRDVGAQGNGSRCHLSAASLMRLPFSDQDFDLVICSEVLEHLEHLSDLSQAVRELARVLAPRGQLVVSVPRRWPEALCWMLSRKYRGMPGGHRRIFKAAQLKTIIQAHGLQHWKTHWAHSLHTPYWWLKCIVGVDRDNFPAVKLYHRFLVWDMMVHPRATRMIERCLNPVVGKSVVLYFKNNK